MNNKEINTMKMSEYQKHVNSTYLNGTYRYGPLLQTSIVGIRNEEIGDYFPDFINYLESNKFLRHVMPWGDFSINENMNPMNSDDGPIIWARPGIINKQLKKILKQKLIFNLLISFFFKL